MKKDDLKKEYDELMKNAQAQPGIKELMSVYGKYENLIRQSHEYLMGTRPKEIISTTNNTT